MRLSTNSKIPKVIHNGTERFIKLHVNSEFQSKFCLNLLENDKNLKTLVSENILKTSKYKAVTVKDFSM